MPAKIGQRATLGQGLDREVYQVVRKLVDDDGQYQNRHQKLSVPNVYERIKKSNSSLNRKSKKLLEDSIERVIEVLKSENLNNSDDANSVDGDFGDVDSGIQSAVTDGNVLNKSLVKRWSTSGSRRNIGPAINEMREEHVSVTMPARDQGGGEPPTKKRKAISQVDRSPPSNLSLADLGGVDGVIQQLEDLIVLPLLRPAVYQSSNIKPPRGVLLHGPPGCGKTMIANAFAAELGVPFISLSAPSLVSGMSGESERAIRDRFDEAKKLAPCLVFLDEIDAITPRRDTAAREMEKRIVAQLLTCLDELSLDKTGGKAVIVLAATNRPDSLDPALRRGGRFDKEINLGVPSEAMREKILRALTRNMNLATDIEFNKLAKRTPGFVGADLNDLASTAGSAAIKRYLENLRTQSNDMLVDLDSETTSETLLRLRRLIKRAREPGIEGNETILISNEDFSDALPKIQPSSKREGFATIPDTTWADIGALRAVREELLTAIVEPIRNPEKYARVGITAPTGILLWGPPGCGKTLLAKAVANESKANFISVKGPELLNKYVGESERAIRQVFVRASSSIPCVIFLDELDAVVPHRDSSQSESSARVVNTLLTELDGMSMRTGIWVIAATNRPDMIDNAMLRPGRLDTLLFVDLPGEDERAEILQTLIGNRAVLDSAEIAEIARKCEDFSGADLQSLLRRAGYAAIKRDDNINAQDFEVALTQVKPSVGDRGKYDRLKGRWGTGL